MPLQLPQMPSFQSAPQPSPMETYGKMLQLRALNGQQQLQPLQFQQQQQENQQRDLAIQQQQLEVKSQQAMMKAWSDPKFTNNFTSNDAADKSGLGFDPNGMIASLVQKGVLPKDAQAMTQQFVERSQKIAATQKDIAQTGEANAGTRDKGYKQLSDRIAGVMDAPAAKAGELFTQLKQDIVKNPQGFAGVPQEDLAHVFGADLEHLPSIATVMGLDAKIADYHKSKAEADVAQQKVIPAGQTMSPEMAAEAAKTVAVETNPQVQAGKAALSKTEALAKQEAAQGNSDDAGKLLANGSLTLADLKTRGSTPKFIEQATMAAQKINPTYNPADEIIAEHIAKSPAGAQFFGSANSLIEKGGTLDQLSDLGKKIPQHDLPTLNTIDDWLKMKSGKGPLAAYAATALGAADDYGKVMGGGNASDHARDAVLKLFSEAESPEQREQAIQATRNAVLSQRSGRIGNNQFLKRQFASGELGGNTGDHQVGGIVVQNGHRYKVTAIDKNGKVTSADPL